MTSTPRCDFRGLFSLVDICRANGVAMPTHRLLSYLRVFVIRGGTQRRLRALSRCCKTPATLAWSLTRDWIARLRDYAQRLRAATALRTRSRDWWLPDTQPASIGNIAHNRSESPVVGLNPGEALLGALGIHKPTESLTGPQRAVA